MIGFRLLENFARLDLLSHRAKCIWPNTDRRLRFRIGSGWCLLLRQGTIKVAKGSIPKSNVYEGGDEIPKEKLISAPNDLLV